MFNVGELVVYSDHGVCKIDDICDKTYGNKTRTYYVLHPVEDSKLSINTPVDSDKVVMLKILNVEGAEEILHTFSKPGTEWIEDVKLRGKEYRRIIQTGNRRDISRIVNTMILKSNEAALNKKQLSEYDRKLLKKTKNLLFEELAVALGTTFEDIAKRVKGLMRHDTTTVLS